MRDINFRAWDGKRMRGVFKIIYTQNDCNIHFTDTKSNEAGHLSLSDDRLHLMQYTGLKDKNGKEIYEGDLVRVYQQDIRVVEFKNAFWTFDKIEAEGVLGGFGTPVEAGHKPLYRYADIEVVGNIYETPHLPNSEPEAQGSDTRNDDSKSEPR